MHTERARQISPIGMTILSGRPSSPTGSSMKPINVLSEPHLPMGGSPPSNSPNAVARLQQTLDKSGARTFAELRQEADDLYRLPAGKNRSTSSGTITRATSNTARDMVAGLFGRRKKSCMSLADAASTLSESAVSSSASSLIVKDSDEEYVYNSEAHAPASLPMGHNRNTSLNSSRQYQRGVAYTESSVLGSLSTARKGSLRRIKSIPLREDEKSKEGDQYLFSPLTLTQKRCDNIMKISGASIAHPKLQTKKSLRKSVHEIFMENDHASTSLQVPQLASIKSSEKNDTPSTSRRDSFRSPAKSLIRKSSTCSSLSGLTDVPASPRSETFVHGSGRAALASVLTSPKFSKTGLQKITSLSPVDYKLPDSEGYVSFPSFVPSSYFGGSLANIFGINENLGLPSSPGSLEKGEEIHGDTLKHSRRRSLLSLAPRNAQSPEPTTTTSCD